MVESTSFYLKINQLTSELANHGYGSLTVKVESLKDSNVKLVVECGKSYVFFIKKDYNINDTII